MLNGWEEMEGLRRIEKPTEEEMWKSVRAHKEIGWTVKQWYRSSGRKGVVFVAELVRKPGR